MLWKSQYFWEVYKHRLCWNLQPLPSVHCNQFKMGTILAHKITANLLLQTYLFSRLLIFVFCRWNVSSRWFIYWLVSLVLMEVLNFCRDLFSWKYLLHKYPENKSLAKLNRLIVFSQLLISSFVDGTSVSHIHNPVAWILFSFWSHLLNLNNSNLVDNHFWATTRQNVSSGVSDQARHKPACAATEAS